MQENKKLSDLVSKLTKEKQELLDQTANTDFNIIKQRVERLESVIDHQTNEIEDWKKKYKDACYRFKNYSIQTFYVNYLQNDQSASIIENMETSFVKENDRLNQINLSHLQKIQNLEQIIKDLEYKLTEQNNQIIAQEEERVNILEQPNSVIKFNFQDYNQQMLFLYTFNLLKNITDQQKIEHDNLQQYDNLKEQIQSFHTEINQINFKTNNLTQLKNNLNELKNTLKNQINE